MEGEQTKTPVFHSDDIKTSKANSDKEYFVNVINDPFQQWLLRKKPAKVKVEQDFETPVPEPKAPEEKPKSPQCRTIIRLTTERLRRDSSRYKLPFTLLSIVSVIVLGLAGFFAFLAFSGGEKKVETKTIYVKVEKEPETPIEPPSSPDDSNGGEENPEEQPEENPENPENPTEPPEEQPEENPEVPNRGGGGINA